MDGALLVHKADLFYFSGTIQDAHLYVPAEGPPVLMVRKDYDRAKTESALDDVIPVTTTRDIPEILVRRGLKPPEIMGMELDVLPVNLFFAYQRLFTPCTIQDVSPMVRRIRAVKSPYEIGLMTEAGRLADAMLESVAGLLAEGMTELQLAARIECRAREMGHQGMVRMRIFGGELFYGHVMAGPSAAAPSFLASPTGGTGTTPAIAQGSGFRPIQRNEPILVDYVFAANGYIADQSRIFAIGDLPDPLIRGHRAMLTVQKALQKAAVPGATAGGLYEMAVGMAESLGYKDHFMGAGPARIRFVGHGVGLELDEYPFIAEGQSLTIEEGMTIALEPKLIFPGQGVVGIENTHVVTPGGLKPFTSFKEDVIFI